VTDTAVSGKSSASDARGKETAKATIENNMRMNIPPHGFWQEIISGL
jgi:hypothetical protein